MRGANDPVPGVWRPAGPAQIVVQKMLQQRQVRARIRLALEGGPDTTDNHEQGYEKMKGLTIAIMLCAILIEAFGGITSGQGTIFDYVLVPLCGFGLGLMAGQYLFKWRG
jgi:hypothetical protein